MTDEGDFGSYHVRVCGEMLNLTFAIDFDGPGKMAGIYTVTATRKFAELNSKLLYLVCIYASGYAFYGTLVFNNIKCNC